MVLIDLVALVINAQSYLHASPASSEFNALQGDKKMIEKTTTTVKYGTCGCFYSLQM